MFALFDPYLVWSYRITGFAFVDFLVGTFVLAFIVIAVGEFTISLAYLANRQDIEKVTGEAVKYQSLSVDAIEAGDKSVYTAANKLANDAFGRTFFFQIALSTGFLWPIPFALMWMQYRFVGVEFPIISPDYTVGYVFLFVPLYAAAYLVFRRVKKRIPYFRRIQAMLDEAQARHSNARSFADLLEPSRGS